jgi:hypothetical protein
MKYDQYNVTRGVREDGENPGYFYAPCRECGKRLNVGNNPPVIVDGKLDVCCFPQCPPRARAVTVEMTVDEIMAYTTLVRMFFLSMEEIKCSDIVPMYIKMNTASLLEKVTHELSKQAGN